MRDGEVAIASDEWLLRRIPEDRGPTHTCAQPSWLAFRPADRDVDGLSLYRELEASARQVAGWGRQGRHYFVGRIRAGAIVELGMTLRATPDPDGRPGHVIIPELTHATRKRSQEEFWQHELARRCHEVVGPLPGLTTTAG